MKRLQLLKIMTLLATVATAVSIASKHADAAMSFTDLQGHWAIKTIHQAVSKGYVDGYPDGTFLPDAPVSRAEFVKMLSAAMEPYLVIVNGDGYQPYLNASMNSGIQREADFTQDMNRPISRMELIRLIVRATNTELQQPAVTLDDKALVYSASKRGLIQGLADGSLGLDETMTRAQAVTVVERVLRLNDGGVLPIDQGAVQLAELGMTGTNFMSVLGVPAGKELPIYYSVGGIGLSVDHITVVDCDDPKSPFASAVSDCEGPNRYVLLFQLRWDLSKLQQDIRIADYVQISGSQPDSFPVEGPEMAAYRESGATPVQLRVSLTKEQLHAYMAQSGLSYTVAGQRVPLFYEQR